MLWLLEIQAVQSDMKRKKNKTLLAHLMDSSARKTKLLISSNLYTL